MSKKTLYILIIIALIIAGIFVATKMSKKEKTKPVVANTLEQTNKRARTERDSKDRAKDCLRSANEELRLRNAERDRTIRENEQLRKTHVEMRQKLNTLKSQLEEQATQFEITRRTDDQAFEEAIRGYQGHLEKKHEEIEKLLKEREDLLEENWQLKGEIVNLEESQVRTQQCLNTLDMQMKDMIAEYEARIKNDKHEVREVIKMYRATIAEKNEEIREWAMERNHYMGLIRNAEENHSHARQELSHWAHKLRKIERIPRLVRRADVAVNPLTTPREAIDLIDVCKELVDEVEKLIKSIREN